MTDRRRVNRVVVQISTLIAILALTGACMSAGQSDDQQPPEREFDESTALERMEEAAAEAIAELPDFPGFHVRTLMKLECTHDGEVDKSYVNYELGYQFSLEVSEEPQVRETYRELLRKQWDEAGYDIHRDTQMGDDPPHYALEARRPDGINLWYRVAGLTVLKIQSGCVEAVEGFYPECPDPLGGVTKENDRARNDCSTIETEYSEEPSETASDEALAPFEGAPAATVPFTADTADPKAFEPPSSYEGQL